MRHAVDPVEKENTAMDEPRSLLILCRLSFGSGARKHEGLSVLSHPRPSKSQNILVHVVCTTLL